MGAIKQWVAKATGADVQADITARGADEQANAIRDSSQKAANAAREAAAQSARQQEAAAAQRAAEGAAADTLNKPLENADVQLSGVTDPSQSASAANKKRRQTFGIGSAGSGVNI